MYKGTRLASAASAYAPPLFLPRSEFQGRKTLFGGVLGEWLSNIPKMPLPRPILPLFSADGRPCAYVFSTVSVSANMYLDADCC